MLIQIIIALLVRKSPSLVASELLKALESSHEGEEADAGFDGGEFSGPASWKARGELCLQIMREGGWSPEALAEEIEARTSPRWLHFSPLSEAFACADEAQEAETNPRRRFYS